MILAFFKLDLYASWDLRNMKHFINCLIKSCHLNLSFIIVFAATGFFHGGIFRLLAVYILKLEEIQFFALQD